MQPKASIILWAFIYISTSMSIEYNTWKSSVIFLRAKLNSWIVYYLNFTRNAAQNWLLQLHILRYSRALWNLHTNKTWAKLICKNFENLHRTNPDVLLATHFTSNFDDISCIDKLSIILHENWNNALAASTVQTFTKLNRKFLEMLAWTFQFNGWLRHTI